MLETYDRWPHMFFAYKPIHPIPYLQDEPLIATHPMTEAWRRYRRMRLGVFLPGDGRGRRFIRSIFAKALVASWAEAKANARQAAGMRHRNKATDTDLLGRRLDIETTAGRLSQDQRSRRIHAVREELRLL